MDLGTLVVETKGPRAHVIIFAGIFLVACGALGFAKPPFFSLAALGIIVIVLGARRPVIRVYERGATRRSRRIDYDQVRNIFDEQYVKRAMDPRVAARNRAGAALITSVDAYIMLIGGSPMSMFRLQRSEQVARVLEQHILPVAVAAWRKKLEAGESYRIPNSIVELKSNECWAPAPGTRRPVLLPFRDTYLKGTFAYREGQPDPVAQHAAFGHDILLRALLRGYGVRVDD